MKTVSDLIGNEYLEWTAGKPYVLSAQTGRGKTTFVMTQLLRNAVAHNKNVLYICNRRALYAQIEQIISDMTQSLKISCSLTEEESQHFTIQTYQYYETRMENPLYSSDVLYIIFDEAHYFLADASFNSRTNLWYDWIRNFYDARVDAQTPICIFMTATPEPLKCFLASIPSMHRGDGGFPAYRFFAEIQRTHKRIHNIKSSVELVKQEHGEKWKENLKTQNPQLLVDFNSIQNVDAFCEFKEFIQTAIHNQDNIVDIIDDELDYSYIEEFYFRDFSALVDNICKSKEKWIIFINDKVRGQKFAQRLNDLGNETVFISAAQKSDFFVRKQLEELETNQSFSCKVLISTAILDCGINILDEQVRNIVIFETEKTAFMQMLGRVRIHANQKIRLFIKAPTALEIRDRVRYACKIIHTAYQFYMFQKMKYSGDDTQCYYEPVMSKEWRIKYAERFHELNRNLFYLKHGLIDGINTINRKIVEDWSDGIPFAEYEMNRNLLVRCSYELYCFDDAKNYTQTGKVDDVYYLKYQLSWLGKSYDEHRWVSYDKQQDEILTFLENYLKQENGILPDEQTLFSKKLFELLCGLPVIPSAAKKNRSALKRENHAPGKNILNKCLEEIKLPYTIISKTKMKNGTREQRWYVEKIGGEHD